MSSSIWSALYKAFATPFHCLLLYLREPWGGSSRQGRSSPRPSTPPEPELDQTQDDQVVPEETTLPQWQWLARQAPLPGSTPSSSPVVHPSGSYSIEWRTEDGTEWRTERVVPGATAESGATAGIGRDRYDGPVSSPYISPRGLDSFNLEGLHPYARGDQSLQQAIYGVDSTLRFACAFKPHSGSCFAGYITLEGEESYLFRLDSFVILWDLADASGEPIEIPQCFEGMTHLGRVFRNEVTQGLLGEYNLPFWADCRGSGAHKEIAGDILLRLPARLARGWILDIHNRVGSSSIGDYVTTYFPEGGLVPSHCLSSSVGLWDEFESRTP